ncbi:MAG: type IV pilus twitching motility protein PilT [Candidatus Omnitrophota bacterium]|nr:type IV pilus twitching motility protein PilT [Candidatus Omnitrophota bacterium]
MLNIQTLFRLTVEKQASDLHLTVGLSPRLRIDGELVPTDFEPLTPYMVQNLAYSILSKEQIETFERDKELDFSFGLKGLSRFRINIYRQRGSIAVAIRRIPFRMPDFEELSLPKMVKKFADSPQGLVLITGVVGSGKSTTLSAMIDYINNERSHHIISIEDPIEHIYKHKKSSIDQREIGTDTLSFANALKHVFRQDPNIILIGEMRDLETIHTALTLAETGHLVLATLHTGDATHAISRIIDVFPFYQQQQIRVQLSLVLVGVMVQQLIPRLDKKGRALAVEVMKVTSAIRNLIRENDLAQIRSIIQVSRKYGMWTMNQSLAELCEKGIISWEEASKRTIDLKELTGLIKKS